MSTEKILSTIATWEMARAVERDVPGMPGFAKHFFERLNPEEQRLVRRYNNVKSAGFRDVAAMAESHPHPGVGSGL